MKKVTIGFLVVLTMNGLAAACLGVWPVVLASAGSAVLIVMMHVLLKAR